MWPRTQKPPTWQDQLLLIMRSLTRDPSLTLDDAIRLLKAAPGPMLLEFDGAVRRSWFTVPLSPVQRMRQVLRQALAQPEEAEVLLFLDACNDNGFVREKALRALRGHTGRLACAAALIRAEDWVPQVATLALRVIESFSSSATSRHFFEFLDLILVLRSRQRFSAGWPAIEKALLRPEHRSERALALKSHRGVTRRFALELYLQADAPDSIVTLASAAVEPSVIVARWALERAASSLSPPDMRIVADAGLRNPIAFVRADALRRLVSREPSDLHTLLTTHLLDPSQSVRQTAAWHLQQRFDQSPLPVWRRHFDTGEMRDTLTVALADFGDESDIGRLRSQLDSRRAGARAAAIRGLWRLDVPDKLELLERGILDPSSRVVKSTTRLYRRDHDLLRREVLDGALTAADTSGQCKHLITAARLLARWDQLPFLLRMRSLRPDDSALIDAELERWSTLANRHFTQPDVSQRAEIAGLLSSFRQANDSKLLARLQFLTRQ